MRKIISTFFTMLLVFSLLCLWPIVTSAQEKVSKPGVYSGYSQQIYDGYKRFSQYVVVRDGTKLAIDIYRPTLQGVVTNTSLPVIWSFTPYRRAVYTGNTMTLAVGTMVNLTKYGYVVAAADVRGKGASYSVRPAMSWIGEGVDGYDINEWLAKQPWCNGNTGMFGGSYVGHTQWSTAAMVPPHLKAIIPEITDYDLYDSTVRGGMHRSTSGGGEGQNDLVTVPVDEDLLDTDNDGYKDMLEEAVAQHAQNRPYLPLVAAMPYRDSWDYWLGYYWIASSASTYHDQLIGSGIGVYCMGGWQDLFTRDTLLGFLNLRNRSKVLMYPGGHFVSDTGGIDLTVERLRFFDYWLKGIKNGIMDEPPIYYSTMGAPTGQQWRFSWQWPLPNEESVNYYLHAGPSGSSPISLYDGTLTTAAPTEAGAKDTYTADYSVTCGHMMGYCVYDKWGVTYTGAPLAKDVELTGHPVVHLWVSSTATDGDFFADLEDVDESGTARSAAVQGRLRASHRALVSAPYDFLNLPWHRSYQFDMMPLISGQPTELIFDILPTSKVFKAGHRIRLTITSASKHVLEFLKSSPAPTISVYRNAAHASYISLPITTESIAATVQIIPGILNLKSQGKFTAFITLPKNLPKGYQIEDIDISTVKCNGASAASGKVNHDTLIAKFDIQDLTDVSAGREVMFTVTGEFNYGIPFNGSDTIRVIGK